MCNNFITHCYFCQILASNKDFFTSIILISCPKILRCKTSAMDINFLFAIESIDLVASS